MNRVHGTRAGYQQHRVLLESPCEPCRLAYNEYQFRYKKERVLKARNGTAWDWYERGHVDAVAACIAAVKQVDGGQAVLVFRRNVLAALREVQP
jgi:hypothetical protein